MPQTRGFLFKVDDRNYEYDAYMTLLRIIIIDKLCSFTIFKTQKSRFTRSFVALSTSYKGIVI